VKSMSTYLKVDVPFRTQQFVILAAQTGNFHRAARTFGVHPSVVVRSIDRLETDLGAKIFERTRSHFTVTEAGKLFVNEIRDAINHVERAHDLLRYHSQIKLGPIRLGYSGYIQSRLIPVLERLELSPLTSSETTTTVATGINLSSATVGSRVLLQSGTTAQLIDRVQRGELHAAFGVQPLPERELWTESITKEPFCLCISKNHRLAKRPSVLAKEMDGEIVFFLPRATHPGLYDQTIEYIESTGAKPALREVVSLTHSMEFVAHNFGVALLPRSASRLSHMGVLFKPITDKLLWIETALFVRHKHADDRLRWFLPELLSQINNGLSER
jgi:LysR family transcriptional regulator, benzoate and cis,cis-muconate-responsive activator of ben and cat genes